MDHRSGQHGGGRALCIDRHPAPAARAVLAAIPGSVLGGPESRAAAALSVLVVLYMIDNLFNAMFNPGLRHGGCRTDQPGRGACEDRSTARCTFRVYTPRVLRMRSTTIMCDPSNIPVFVLCGGQGTRLREETVLLPKPMVPIGNRPILWHIMRTYAYHGFRRFVLCLGYKAEVIKSYFLNYASMNSDFTVELKTNDVAGALDRPRPGLAGDAGLHRRVDHDRRSRGPSRREVPGIRRAFRGDLWRRADRCQSSRASSNCIYQHDKIGTVLGVNPPSRFGQIKLDG